MLFLLFAGVLFSATPSSAAAELKGAGARFPSRLYSEWAGKYFKKTGVRIAYQSTGSTEGLRLVKDGVADFGSSNRPLSPEELKEASLYQFPVIIRGIVPVVNLEGVGFTIGVDTHRLKLTPGVLADIYLGRIRKWTDERLAALNPGIKLPDEDIIVATRSRESGTTWIFTKYLSRISKAWLDTVGSGFEVKWPVGSPMSNTAEMADFIKKTPNSIGFAEYTYVINHKLSYAEMQNRNGAFVAPYINNFTAAGAAVDWKANAGFSGDITDQAGKKVWPITGATYILIRKNPSDCKRAEAVLAFFDWAFRNGNDIAEANDYAPITPGAHRIIEKDWTKELTCGGEPLWKKRR